MSHRAAWVLTCVIMWTDLYPLAGMAPDRDAFQEVRQQLCVSERAAMFQLQQRVYFERRDGEGNMAIEGDTGWKAFDNSFYPNRAITVPLASGTKFDEERMIFQDAAPCLSPECQIPTPQ